MVPFPANAFFAANRIAIKNRSLQLEIREKFVCQRRISVLELPSLPQNQLSVPGQVLLHLFVHLLVRRAGAAHLILALYEDLAYFLVEPVFDGQLLEHALADARGHCALALNLNLPAFHQALHHFSCYVSYKIPYEQHL
jgi:hypothetical protein